jgi:hypothetical protein
VRNYLEDKWCSNLVTLSRNWATIPGDKPHLSISSWVMLSDLKNFGWDTLLLPRILITSSCFLELILTNQTYSQTKLALGWMTEPSDSEDQLWLGRSRTCFNFCFLEEHLTYFSSGGGDSSKTPLVWFFYRSCFFTKHLKWHNRQGWLTRACAHVCTACPVNRMYWLASCGLT